MRKIQNEQWINALPKEAVNVAEEINIEIAKVIAERIKEIGELSPADIKKLTNSLQYLGADFGKITKLIAKYANKGQMEVVDMLKEVADSNDEFANVFYSGKGIAAVKWQEDTYLRNLVEAMARQTVAEFTNLSQTLAYKIDDRTLSLRQMYTRAIDKAIYEAQSGTVDYHTAMRKTVKQLANNMRVLQWDSGYTRRLDSHIRQNLIDGIKQLQQEMLNYHGERFGSDGVELSAHAISAPDHVAVQGRQFSNEEFFKMQTGQNFKDIKDNEYEGFARPIGQWNCRHVTFPIIIGISEPAYTEEQLKEFAENSKVKYDLTQRQRAMETKLRQLKIERLTASAAGDELEAKRIQRQINQKQKEYREFCQKHGLTPQPERARVPDYKRISAVDKTENNVIIKERSFAQRNLAMGLRKPRTHILSENEILQIKEDINAINADERIFRFNSGLQTSYVDEYDIINIRGDVLPDKKSNNPRDLMSSRAVIAHEYYGHRAYRGTQLPKGSWNDEFRASYMAAKNTPNLTDEDRRYLILDAVERAKEKGVSIKYNEFIRRTLYGY